ncbi:MAG: mandelate racemase/muconate lactonizing enzyme family protein [Halobacteriaceae archaeon]
MEITDVVVHTLALPDVAARRADGTQDAAIVEVETDTGLTGVGEADASPPVVEAIVDAPASHDKSAGLREVLVGRDPRDVEALYGEMYDRTYFFGRRGAAIVAISGVDMALWDLAGKAADTPLYRLLGGGHRETVRAYASTLFPEDPTDTAAVRRAARGAREDGFTAVKFGWGGFGEDPATDRDLVGAARDALGAGADLLVDAGMAWAGDPAAARADIRTLDAEADLFWVEEPVSADEYDAYRALAEATDTRVVGGEEAYTEHGFREFLDRGRPDGVQPDSARAGGPTQMRRIATLARERGVPLYPHGFSTGVVLAANLHLCAAVAGAPLVEYCVADSPLRWGVTEESFPVEDGRVAVPTGPGLGVTLDRETLAEYATDG